MIAGVIIGSRADNYIGLSVSIIASNSIGANASCLMIALEFFLVKN